MLLLFLLRNPLPFCQMELKKNQFLHFLLFQITLPATPMVYKPCYIKNINPLLPMYQCLYENTYYYNSM